MRDIAGTAPSLRASLNRLPQPQQRAWGTITTSPGRGAMLVLAPPATSVTLAFYEAMMGSYPVLNGRESPFSVAGLLSGAVASITGAAAQTVAGGSSWSAMMTAFLAGLLAAVSAAVVRRAASRCRAMPLPYEACRIACAIEHASAVARAHTGFEDYDQDVMASVRSILWESSGIDLPGASLPLSRVLNAVLERNRALLGPHASPAWYPAVTEDPVRHPPAPERASETAGFLAAALREEATLIRDSSLPGR